MNIKENMAIKILNYNPFVLSVTTNISNYRLQPCYDFSAPTSANLTYGELVYVNQNSTGIKNGLIRFDKEQEKDIYEALSVLGWEKILKNEEIEDILINPTLDKLQRIVDILDESVFDRVVAIYQGLISSNAYDISNRVMNLIAARKDEFRKNNPVSKIQLTALKSATTKKDDEVQKVKEQNEKLQEQLNQMQAMMAQLLASQGKQTDTPKPPSKKGTKTTK